MYTDVRDLDIDPENSNLKLERFNGEAWTEVKDKQLYTNSLYRERPKIGSADYSYFLTTGSTHIKESKKLIRKHYKLANNPEEGKIVIAIQILEGEVEVLIAKTGINKRKTLNPNVEDLWSD